MEWTESTTRSMRAGVGDAVSVGGEGGKLGVKVAGLPRSMGAKVVTSMELWESSLHFSAT